MGKGSITELSVKFKIVFAVLVVVITSVVSYIIIANNKTQDPTNFYSCANGSGVVSSVDKLFVCKINGKIYKIPTTFSNEDIIHYSSLPTNLKSVISLNSKNNFLSYRSGCVPYISYCVYPRVEVEVITPNFVDLNVLNYNFPQKINYALVNGDWQQLASSINPFEGCANVKQYQITKSSFLDPKPPDPTGIDVATVLNQCQVK